MTFLPRSHLWAVLLAAGCAQPAAEEAAATESVSGGKGEVRKTLVVVEPLTVGLVQDEIVVTAKVAARVTVQVFPKQSGLPVTSVSVEEGDRVVQGDLLMTLYDEELRLAEQRARASLDEARRTVEQQHLAIEEAERRLEAARYRADQDRSELQRLQELGDLVSRKDVDLARQTTNTSAADLDLANLGVRGEQLRLALAEIAERKASLDWESAQVVLGHTRIRAPITGLVASRDTDVGELSNMATPAFRLVDLDDLILDLRAPQDSYGRLAVGQPVKVRAVAQPDAQPFLGVVRTVNPVLDELTGTAHVIVDLQPAPGLVPGLFCEARVVTSEREDALLVSKRAVLYEDAQPVIFALNEDASSEALSARRIPFLAGATTPTNVEILSDLDGVPLQAELRIVVVGQESLKDGAPVEVVQEAF